jgi:archaemetzincin
VKSIHLVAVGAGSVPGPRERLAPLGQALFRTFHLPVRVRAESVDAVSAWDAMRDQYYSSEILRLLQPFAAHGTRVLGVTSLDLFVPVLTFVFGEAQLEGQCALVSYHRLREEFYGLPEREPLLEERLVKEAVHELGHTYGLRHCLNWECVMASSHAVEILDVKGTEFCGGCRRVVTGR